MATKRIPDPHHLLVDSNILRAKDEAVLVSPTLSEFLQIHGIEFPITLLVPSIVRDEVIYQQFRDARSGLNAAKTGYIKANSILGKNYKLGLTEGKIKIRLNELFNKWLESLHGQILEVPVEEIDFLKVIDRAVWRRPPFEHHEKKEKGFRDAMILETLRHHVSKCTSSQLVAFICNDELLRETAESELSEYSNLNIYASLNDFESYIKLTKQDITEEFAQSIRKKINRKFFDPKNDKCLYIAEAIREKIVNENKDAFKHPASSSSGESLSDWTPAGKGMFWIHPAEFSESPAKGEYIWLHYCPNV
jgi:hypothetical protein